MRSFLIKGLLIGTLLFLVNSPLNASADNTERPQQNISKMQQATSKDKIDRLQDELDKTKSDQLQSNIDAFNRSSDAANRLISWVGIVATIYGIIIALASLFVGFISIRNQKRSDEALKTLEGAKSYVDKKLGELDEVIKNKNDEISKRIDDFIQLSLEQLTEDTQEATKKIKEIEEKGITTETSKRIELLERRIKLFDDIGMPDDPKVLYSKAMVYEEKKEYQEALELLHKATRHDPKYASAFFRIGYIQDTLKEYEKAIAAYDKAIELDPKNSGAWNNKGVAFRKLGKTKDALDCYNKAISLNPADALYHKNKIALLSQSEENREELIKSYDALITIQPEEPGYCLRAGRFLSNIGRFSDAAKYYQSYLELRKKKVAAPDAKESDLLCYYEALLLTENYKEALSLKARLEKDIKGESEQVINTLLSIYMFYLQGNAEKAEQLRTHFVKLVEKSSYAELGWNFDDINPLLKKSLSEDKYQLCVMLQKAAEKEVSLDSVKIGN